ncbi:unnamed protein product [Urochloa humidicola]
MPLRRRRASLGRRPPRPSLSMAAAVNYVEAVAVNDMKAAVVNCAHAGPVDVVIWADGLRRSPQRRWPRGALSVAGARLLVPFLSTATTVPQALGLRPSGRSWRRLMDPVGCGVPALPPHLPLPPIPGRRSFVASCSLICGDEIDL